MGWFKRKMVSSEIPIGKTVGAPLSVIDAQNVIAQMMRFVMPVYETGMMRASDEAEFLLAYTKPVQPWSEFLPRFTCPFEASLALLDDSVTALRYFYHHPEAKFVIEDPEEFREHVGKEAHDVATAQFSKLEDAVDFALAYITINIRKVNNLPKNGHGLNRGMLLYKEHQKRLGIMFKKD